MRLQGVRPDQEAHARLIRDLATLIRMRPTAGVRRAERKGVLYINPGSAGPRRFDLPVTVARLDVNLVPWEIEFLDLSRRGIRMSLYRNDFRNH